MSNLRMADVHWLRQMELSSAQRVKKKKKSTIVWTSLLSNKKKKLFEINRSY